MRVTEVLEACEGPYRIQFLYQDPNTNEPFWEDPYRRTFAMARIPGLLDQTYRRSWRLLTHENLLVTGYISPADRLLYGVIRC